MLTSAVGRKTLAAATGLLLVGFVFLHMAGHLLMFKGQDAYNSYAEKLQSLGPIKWAARAALAAIAAVHVYCTITLALDNRKARPVGYQKVRSRRATLWSRTMAISGLVTLGFLVFHILHFTTKSIDTSYADMMERLPGGGERHDTYRMFVAAFTCEWMLLLYAVGMALLFGHLAHGIGSFPHTLGLTNHAVAPWFKRLAPVASGILVAGFLIVPLWVYVARPKPPATPPNLPAASAAAVAQEAAK